MKKAQPFIDLLIGLLYIILTLLEYVPLLIEGNYVLVGEWCFVTGIVGGLFFIVSGILGFFNIEIPAFLHLYNTTLLSFILVCTVAFTLNLEGFYWFNYVIGPLLVLSRFFIYCDCRKIEMCVCVLVLAIFPVIYTVITYLLLQVFGSCPIPSELIFQIDDVLLMIIISFGFIALIIGLGYALLYLNRFIFRRLEEGK